MKSPTEEGKYRISKQDKVMLRHDKKMLCSIDLKKLDKISLKWLREGR
jgi:hypothetical protein